MELAKSRQKILVIDDEVEIGEMICEILNPHFETVRYFSEAEKVPEHLDQVSYDLVLSDINMPKLDGTNLVTLLRSKGHLVETVRHVIEVKKRRHQLNEIHRDPDRAHAEAKMIGLFQAKRARKRA